IAWLPKDQVFLRVVQLPAVDRQELMSMLEFQLEKISPLPVGQIAWSAEVLPIQAGNKQTAIVCVVARDAIEEFLGTVEASHFQPDRLEVPHLNQLLADGQREDGGWLYPGTGPDADFCMVAWWAGGALQDLQFLRLPQPAASEPGSGLPDVRAARSQYLHEQLMQVAWAGELEGWLTLPVQWRLVADEQAAAYWRPLIGDWAEDGVEVHPALDRTGLAKFAARRAIRGEHSVDLLPLEFTARYHQQYIDRLWMRGLGALVAVYLVGVVIYMATVQVYSYQDNRLKTQFAGISNNYTNVLRLKERVQVLQEQLNLKYAALDCWKVTSELLPEGFSLVNLVFGGRGRSLQVHGTAPQDQQQKVLEYNDAVRKATVNGQLIFKDVTPPNINSRGGSQNINWNFECRLNVSDAE
ncbi:MAG TPA: hypothetical protein VK633_10490, partial [Verrucomicrobiae bacterium]|nr:hypothetical protein [Verrucomicrobiae bacterium]